ncbi:MAG: hypothetical protein QM572_18460, partial [Nocardioides sp.]|uniref:hypothetical protein n=1 Tax=Nocardioides sp. TaxID=35761 RepID=UPI0039E2D66E
LALCTLLAWVLARALDGLTLGEATADPRRRPWPWLPYVAAALVVLVAVVTLIVASRQAGSDDGARGDASSSASTGSSASPTAEGVRAFVADYLATAPTDPAAGFAMLTPAYQGESGGLSGYEAFWSKVSITDIGEPSVQLDPLEATYTYSYTLPKKGTITETVTLSLTYDGSRYLIAGARS